MKNRKELDGRRAGDIVYVGDFKRYAIYPVHTKSSHVEYVCSDAEKLDASGRPSVVARGSFAFVMNHVFNVLLGPFAEVVRVEAAKPRS